MDIKLRRAMSEEEVSLMNKKLALKEKYSIPVGIFDDEAKSKHYKNNTWDASYGPNIYEGIMEDYEFVASEMISAGKEIPPELHKKLMDTLEERKLRNRERELLTKAASAGVRTPEDIKRVYGFEFKDKKGQ